MSKIQADEEVKLNKNIPQKPEIGYHYPLYLISVITGLCVLVDAKRYKAKNSFLHKLYSICLVTIIIYGALYSGRGRVLYIYKYLLQTVRINDIIQQILLTISTVYAILNILFRGVKIINVYFEKLQKIDKQLLTTMNLKKKKILSHVRLVTYHIIIISISIGDFFAWSYSMGYEAWIYYGFRLYMFYLNLLIVLQLTTFTCALHTRFAIVNERLLDSFMHWSNELDCRKKREIMNELCPEVLTISFVKYLPVACITSIHDMLCDLLDVVNDIFGFDIFFLVANIIINCVLSLNAILIFGTGLQVATNQDGDWAILVLNAAWALFCIVLGINITWSCTYCANEACKTAGLAYKLLNMVPAQSSSDTDKIMREELFQLAQQVQYRKPGFSAAGFFDVNHALMHAIMGAISSYIIIVIQFNNSPIPIYNNSTTLMRQLPYNN